MQDIDNAKPAANASETGAAAGMSLLDAIAAYRAGSEIGERRTINPTRERIEHWPKPARSRVEAIEALKLARDEAIDFVGSVDIIPQMISVSLSFLSMTDGPMSLQPSQDMAFALRVIEFLETERAKIGEAIKYFEAQRFGQFAGNFEDWKKWADGTDHSYLVAQADALDEVFFKMEDLVRVRECRTLGDLLAKMSINDRWVSRSPEKIAETDADSAIALLRSIVPLTRKIGALPASETVSQQA